MSRFYVAALTGQSGTGKSFASEYLAKKGIPVLDADAVAREVVVPGSPCLLELAKEFGDRILLEDGGLDRRKLAEICFSDPKRKARLDAVTHPHIIGRMLGRFDELRGEGKKYCVAEAAALIESGFYAKCDKIILITAEREQQVERIMRRDGITAAAAETRIGAQVSSDRIRALADYVIENNGDLEAFRQKLNELPAQFDRWFKD